MIFIITFKQLKDEKHKIFTFMLLFYNYINNFTNALCCCWVFS